MSTSLAAGVSRTLAKPVMDARFVKHTASYPPFRIGGDGKERDPTSTAQQQLEANVNDLHAALLRIGWPKEVLGSVAPLMDERVAFPSSSGTVSSVAWYPELQRLHAQLTDAKQACNRAGNALQTPSLTEVEVHALQLKVDRCELPALFMDRGVYSKKARTASNIYDEELKRLAVSYIWGVPLPTEAVKPVLDCHNGSPAASQVALLLGGYCKAVKIVGAAARLQQQWGGHLDPSRLVSATQQAAQRAVVSVHRQTQKLAAREQSMARWTAAQVMWQQDNPGAGSPRSRPEAQAAGLSGGSGAPWRPPPPPFNDQELQQARGAVARFAASVCMTLDEALAHPERLYAALGNDRTTVPKVVAGSAAGGLMDLLPSAGSVDAPKTPPSRGRGPAAGSSAAGSPVTAPAPAATRSRLRPDADSWSMPAAVTGSGALRVERCSFPPAAGGSISPAIGRDVFGTFWYNPEHPAYDSFTASAHGSQGSVASPRAGLGDDEGFASSPRELHLSLAVTTVRSVVDAVL